MERNRKLTYKDYKGKKTPKLAHTFLDYDRYFEAHLVYSFLKKNSWHNQSILDYGCGVGDYGIFLINKGHSLVFYDIDKVYTDFVKFRLKNKKLKGKVIDEKTTNKVLFKRQDVIIFGEVLEHLTFPQRAIKACVESEVKIIVTTSYMFRKNKAYFLTKGHKLSAYWAQNKCLTMLREKYEEHEFDNGGFRIWTRK